MPRIIHPSDLPILTDIVDEAPLDLPMLTEVIEEQIDTTPRHAAIPLSDPQCEQLAALLFPQLEAVLRDAIGSRSEARWHKAMQQVRTALPELIRSSATRPKP